MTKVGHRIMKIPSCMYNVCESLHYKYVGLSSVMNRWENIVNEAVTQSASIAIPFCIFNFVLICYSVLRISTGVSWSSVPSSSSISSSSCAAFFILLLALANHVDTYSKGDKWSLMVFHCNKNRYIIIIHVTNAHRLSVCAILCRMCLHAGLAVNQLLHTWVNVSWVDWQRTIFSCLEGYGCSLCSSNHLMRGIALSGVNL